MKQIFSPCLLLLLVAFFALTGCYGAGGEHDEGRTFRVEASFELDSAMTLDHLVMFDDNHLSLRCDTLSMSRQNTVEYEGHTSSLNELFLCSDGGELCRLYAREGMEIGVNIASVGDSLKVSFSASERDSINPWLQSQLDGLSKQSVQECKDVVDAVCHEMPGDVRSTLLLRESIDLVKDSLFVRQCLGALSQEAKPSWLVKNIEQVLAANSMPVWRSKRLVASSFDTSDSITFEMVNQRSDYLLIYLWADYAQASIDSMKVLNRLLSEEYDMKRIFMCTFCLSAPDSVWWRQQIEDVDARHVWLTAGLSDARISDWRVRDLPCLILCDMYNNVQQYNVWGKALRDALWRVPNRSGFIHTNQTKNNGRPNNLSRPSRH